MVKVAGVKFKSAGKVYYFDPVDLDIVMGTNVIVETARGLEFGSIAAETKEISEDKIVSPLKKILRIATDSDIATNKENERKKIKTLEQCQEKIDKHKLEMKLVDVEFAFDKSKLIFYFTADGRIDFRDLVKDLAGLFRTRIELRQIGVRDESKMLGGIGNCGKGICCNTWLGDFEPVSIKMAKVQNLSLNPTKISGVCGRLMCCLKYENDTYIELKKGMPESGEYVRTPEGVGLVVDTNIFRGIVKVRLLTDEKGKDEEDKLSSDITAFKKEDIKRQGSARKNRPAKEKPEELPLEIEELLRD